MPIYTYLCKRCSKKFDFLVGVSQEKNQLKCPFCDSREVGKILTGFSIAGRGKGGSKCNSCSGGACSTCG